MLTAIQIVERQSGVGGSDSAPALGLSKRKTSRQLFHEKRGELEPDVYDQEAIWWGNALEPIVRQKYSEVSGNVVRLPEGTIWHPVHDFMCAHIDGYVDNTSPKRGYEGKTAFHSTGWGEEGTDQIPTEYLMQVQHYMAVTGLPVFDVSCLIGRRFAFYQVEADLELHEMIIEGERDFMRRVRENDPPPLDYTHKTALDVIKKLYPGTNGTRLVATVESIEWRAAMDQAAEAEKLAKREKESYKARLLEFMGEAALLAFPDGKAFRRQTTNRKSYIVDATSFIDARFVNDTKPTLYAYDPGSTK
jgi:putative phage-type endonuclease